MGAEFNVWANMPAVIPELGLTLLAVIVLGLDLFLPKSRQRAVAIVAAVGMLLLAITPFICEPGKAGTLYWGGMVRYDTLAQIFKVIVMLAGAITSLIAIDVKGIGRRGEFYLVVIVATLGACLISAAADLIMVFIGLETLSIPLYILATLNRNDARSSESGLKYFLFGAFSSAMFLYGLSLLYGFTGYTNLYALADALRSGAVGENAFPVLASIVLIMVGLGFKISMVPFHFWTPDVYEGAPTPVTAYVSVASKAASFALLIRFLIAITVFPGTPPETLVVGGENIQSFWVALIALASVVTMTLGNVLALVQKNIKRLLAYSSIAQAGYTLIGVAAIQSLSDQGVASVVFYMIMYTFTNLLAFGVIILFSEATGSEMIADLGGLNRRNPWLALAMTVALLSLGGIPPAAGFVGKFFLFNAAVEANLVWLAVIAVMNAIVALYYYLVVIKVMYVDHSEYEDQEIPVSRPYLWALGIASAAVILLGTIAVSPVFEWARTSALALFM